MKNPFHIIPVLTNKGYNNRRLSVNHSRIVRRAWVTMLVSIFFAFGSTAMSQVYWDTNGSSAGTGGTGNWNTTSALWNDSTGLGTPVVWPNLTTSSAIFGGTAGTVTISTTGIQANSLVFNTDAYVLAGGSPNILTLVGALPFIDVSTGTTIASAVVAGTAGLEKKGAGTLWVQTATTYSGGTIVSQGILRLGSTASGTSDPRTFIDGNTLALNNGGLEIYASSSGNSDVSTTGITISGTSSITTFRTATTAAASISTSLGPVSINGQLTWNVAGNSLASNTSISNLVLTLGATTLTGSSTFVATGNGTLNTNIRLGAVTESGGSRSFTKAGGGALRFDGTNTYTGTTLISEGSIYLSSTGSLSTSSAVVLNPGVGQTAQLDLSTNGPHTESVGSLANSGSGTASVSLGSSNLTVGGDNSSTSFGGAISGTGGSLIKTGSGTLSLTVTNSFTGGLFINSGTLRIANSIAALGALPGSAASSVFLRGGTLLADVTTGTLDSGSNRGFEIGPTTGSGSVTIQVDGSNQLTIQGVIADSVGGSGRLIKTGAGTLRLQTNDKTFTGGLSIIEGAVSVASDGRLGAVPITATPGNLLINGGTLAITGSFTLSANRGIALGPDTGSGSGTFNISSGSTLTYLGIIANNGAGSGRLIKSGDGTLRLENNPNTFSGGVTVLAGDVSFGIESRFGLAPGTPTPGSIVLNGGALTLTDNVTLNSNRGIALGPLSGTGNGIFNVTLTNTLTYGGIIADNGSGSGRLIKTGTGTLRLVTSANTFTGGITVQSGLLSFTIDSRLGAVPASPTPANIILNGGGLRLTQSNETLNANRGIALGPDTGTGTGVLSVESAITLSYGGIIANNGAGTGSLDKADAGSLVLSAANTYSGGTSVTAGTLLLTNTTGSATGTGVVSVSSTGTIGGTGTIAPTGTNAVSVSGTLSPGVAGTNDGVGTLTFTPADGNVKLESTGSVLFQLRSNGQNGLSLTYNPDGTINTISGTPSLTGNDRLVFASTGTGILDFSTAASSSFDFAFVGGYTPALMDAFDLLDWNNLAVSGLSTGQLDLPTLANPMWYWDTSKFVSNGVIAVAATVVPEPSRALLLLAGLGSLLFLRRRPCGA